MTTAFDNAINEFSRNIVWLVIIKTQTCSLEFGVDPCEATGAPCYNTFSTCKDRDNFDSAIRDDEFCSVHVDPFPGETSRDYILNISMQPTEIKESTFPDAARVTITMADVKDNDVMVDKYVSRRSYDALEAGSFLKTYFKRNRNYYGTDIEIYKGTLGLDRSEYKQIFTGTMGKPEETSDGVFKIPAIDLLSSLKGIKVPPEVDIDLAADITAVATQMTLTTVNGLYAAPGEVALGKELIQYAAIDVPTNRITGLTRGAEGTEAKAFTAGQKVQPVRFYAADNGFNHAKDILLNDAGYDASRVDSTAIDAARDWPGNNLLLSRRVLKPTTLDKIYFSLMDVTAPEGTYSWVAENLKITVARKIPNDPDRAYHYLTDAGDILSTPEVNVEYNPTSRVSTTAVYYSLELFTDPKEKENYRRRRSDTDDSALQEYGEDIPLDILTEWIGEGYSTEEHINNGVDEIVGHHLLRSRDPHPLLDVSIDIKDTNILTGEFVRMTTDAIVDFSGQPVIDKPFQVMSRRPKAEGKITLRVLELPDQQWDFITPDDMPEYDSATLDQQAGYGFITDEEGLINDLPGKYIY